MHRMVGNLNFMGLFSNNFWIGSVVTAILFETGKFALGLYFGQAEPGSGYGTA